MSRNATVRSFGAHEWRVYRELRLAALAEAPDAFGSTLDRESPWADEIWMRRLAEGAESPHDLPLVAEAYGRPVGLAWGRIDARSPEVAHLFQMWVAPSARRQGIGARLLDAVVRWARAAGAGQLLLSVTRGDTPAARLYARAGFVPAGEPEPIRPGSETLAQPLMRALRPDAS